MHRIFLIILISLLPALSQGKDGDIQQLLQLIDYIGVDLASTNGFQFPQGIFTGKGLMLGCIDSRNSRVERASGWADMLSCLITRVNPSKVILSPNTDLEYVPKKIADKKMKALSEMKRLLDV